MEKWFCRGRRSGRGGKGLRDGRTEIGILRVVPPHFERCGRKLITTPFKVWITKNG